VSTNDVLIHVRFAPDGRVTEIGERPASIAPHAWFDLLSTKVGGSYQPLSGGRGVFRVTRDEITALQPVAV
jgi:hypothetical protein